MNHSHHFSHKSERKFSIYWILAIVVAALVLTLVVLIPLVQAQEGGRAEREPKEGQKGAEPVEASLEMTAVSGGIGSISGTVTDESSGLPLPDISIQVFDYPGPEEPVATGQTNADGSYLVDGLSFGNYQVGFFDLLSGDFLTEFFDDAFFIQNAVEIVVISDETVPDIDAELFFPGQISGRVTAADGGAPLPDILIEAFYQVHEDWDVITSTMTAGDGTYIFNDLASGQYRLRFYDESSTYGTVFYGDVVDIEGATDVSVSLDDTTSNIDVALPTWGHISGIVTANNGGMPIAGVWVEAYSDDCFGGSCRFISSDRTDSSGSYDIGGLIPGGYYLFFENKFGNYVEEYYNDAEDILQADKVAVSWGDNTTVDVALTELGRIAGTVTAEDGGAPLEGISVSVYELEYGEWRYTYSSQSTDANGHYELRGFQPGTYRLRFGDNHQIYRPEFYQDAQNVESGTDIAVAMDQTTSGIDAALSKFGLISGQVTAEDTNLPIEGISVYSYEFDGSRWNIVDYASTDAAGFYTLGGMNTNNYRARFYVNSPNYISEFYENAPDIESAVDIPVTLSETTADINASLTPSGHITGTVTDEDDGTPLAGINVVIYRFNGSNWVYFQDGYTDANGFYDIAGLETGNYRVRFYGSGSHVSEYYDDVANFEEALDIPVVNGQYTTGIDAELVERGNITGRITSQVDGQPLENVSVRAFLFEDDDWYSRGSAVTDVNGHYDVDGLPAGIYKLRLQKSNYLMEYYNNAPDIEGADEVVVSNETTTSGIDMAMTAYGRINGTVTVEGDGQPLQDSRVTLYRFQYDRWESTDFEDTDVHGHYEFDGLTPDNYRLSFTGGSSSSDDYEYKEEYYNDAPDLAGADDIPVTWNQIIDIDVQLTTLSNVGGRIVDELTGDLVKDCRVIVYQFNGGTWEEVASTWVDGTYKFTGLTPGTYRLKFDPHSDNYQDEFYENAADIESAADIVVVDDQSILNIDAALTPQGRISGFVTDELTGEPLENITVYPYYEFYGDWKEARGREVQTDANGYYETGLLSNDIIWRIRFAAEYDENFISEFYDDAPDVLSARDISVPLGTTVTGIDAALTMVSKQTIEVLKGWNMISSFIRPNPATMSVVFNRMWDDLLLCKNGEGQVFWPYNLIDQIGDWNPEHAYQCYMINPGTLQISGTPIVAGEGMELHQGWNMIAYWLEEPLAVASAVAACGDQILLAKNGAGQIYWPEFGLNQIGEMQPGQGYQLYLTEPCTFSYPQN